MSKRKQPIFALLLVLLFPTLAQAIPPPIHVTLNSYCQEDEFSLQVWVENWEPSLSAV